MRAAKVVVLVWLLAPGPYSGSRLLFSHLLAPLHTKVASSAPLLASKVVSYLDTVSCLLCVLTDLLRPLADTSTAVRVIVIIYLGISTLSIISKISTQVVATLHTAHHALAPPLTCATAMFTHAVTSAPGHLAAGLAELPGGYEIFSRSLFYFLNVFADYVMAAISVIWATLCNITNIGLSYTSEICSIITDGISLMISAIGAIISFLVTVLGEPFACVRSCGLALGSLCHYLSDTVISYYEYNQHFPLLFSDVFKDIKITTWSTVSKTVYNVANYLDDAFAENLVPILNQLITAAHNCWKVSQDGVSEVLFKLQPALNDIYTVVANWSIMIQDFIITSCDAFSLFIQNAASFSLQYFIYCVHEILKILIAIYESILKFIVVSFKNTLNHYHQNKKQPRLFSQVFKQMIKQIK